MKRPFRPSQAALHTWSGLLVGWILYLIFVNGTVSYWREELTRWARPELAATHQVEPVLKGALAFLAGEAPDAESWTIVLPSERQSGAVASFRSASSEGRPAQRGASNETLIGPDGRPAVVRETEGGDFFYRLHFDLRYVPILWGRWIVGFCTMFMLVAIVTGVITHKKIFADFSTFRPGKGQRSWMDGHNALAVLALPFHAMITYTGLITLMTIYMPWGVAANFDGRSAFFRELFPRTPAVETSGQSAPLYPVPLLVDRAEAAWGARAGWVKVDWPGDASARVTVTRHGDASLVDGAMDVVFDGVTGERLSATAPLSATMATRGGMIGLHAGRFAPLTLRWLFFLSGIAGSAMVATGLLLWTAKRRARLASSSRPHTGFWLVERLNVGIIAGLPLSMASWFWANRLLPTGLEARAAWEVHATFICLGVTLAVAFALRPKIVWPLLLGTTAIALATLPLFNLVATDRGLISSFVDRDWAMFGMDIGLALTGVGFGALAWLALAKSRAAPTHLARPTANEPVAQEQAS